MNAIQSFENRIWRKRSLTRAVLSTYTIWAKSYPEWEDACFDKFFILNVAMPILSRCIERGSEGGTNELVQAWATHLRLNPQRRQQQRAKLAPVARDFLHILAGEYAYQCQRRQQSTWYKLWHGAQSTLGQPATQT